MLIDRDSSWQGPCWFDIRLDSDYYMYYDPTAEAQCDECLFEAWERMTYGGILVRELRDGVYLMAARDRRANAAC